MRANERLARAYRRGTGVRLTADEVRDLVESDDAIETVVGEINDEYYDKTGGQK